MHETIDAERILREAGIRITRPRVEVYDYILSKCTHPTCEEIYDGLKDSNPSLSIATVYNVTEKLVEEELLVKLTSPSGERRFDGTLEFHGHFYCDSCGKVFDFDCDRKAFSSKNGFDVKNLDVTATGLCPDCRSK